MKITTETVVPFTALAVDHMGKIKSVKITRTVGGYAAYTSRGARYSNKDLAEKLPAAIKLAERKLNAANKRLVAVRSLRDKIASNIEAAKVTA